MGFAGYQPPDIRSTLWLLPHVFSDNDVGTNAGHFGSDRIHDVDNVACHRRNVFAIGQDKQAIGYQNFIGDRFWILFYFDADIVARQQLGVGSFFSRFFWIWTWADDTIRSEFISEFYNNKRTGCIHVDK